MMKVRALAAVWGAVALVGNAATAAAGANPNVPFYGWTAIVASPNPAVAGQPTSISVTVNNDGDAAAHGVDVKLSFNDWGVTYFGWQEIGRQAVDIPAGASVTLTFEHVFPNAAHTCLEVILTPNGDEPGNNANDDRGQINMEVVHAGGTYTTHVPIRNRGDAPIRVVVQGNCEAGGGQRCECQKLCERDPDVNACIERCRRECGHCPNVIPKQEVALDPGEQLDFPIEIPLAWVPVGGQACFLFEAGDAGDPNDVRGRNYARVCAVHETPRNLIDRAIAIVDAVAAGAARGPGKRLGKSTPLLFEARRSVAPGDPDFEQLRASGGDPDFDQLRKAAKAMEDAQKDLPLREAAEIGRAIGLVVDAARILAQGMANHTGHAHAQNEVAKGDRDRLAGDAVRAIDHYRKAYHHAVKTPRP